MDTVYFVSKNRVIPFGLLGFVYRMNKFIVLVMATLMYDQMNAVLLEEKAKVKSYR